MSRLQMLPEQAYMEVFRDTVDEYLSEGTAAFRKLLSPAAEEGLEKAFWREAKRIAGDTLERMAREIIAGENPFVVYDSKLATKKQKNAPEHLLPQKFECVSFHTPKIPAAMNVTGKLLSQEENLKDLLAAQVVSPVRFHEDLLALLEAGAEDFLEIGPGKVLSGLCKRTARALGKKVRIRTIQSAEDLCRCTA